MQATLTNRILSRLPDAEFARLKPLLRPVALAAGERLSEAGEPPQFLYFPEDSVIAYLAEMQDGKSAEIGMVGREGVAGMTTLLDGHQAPHSLNVAIGGNALKMRKDDFEREMLRAGNGIQQTLLDYAASYVTQVSQRSACAVLHLLEQRLAVWLLLVADRLDTDVIHITQERIGQHLGVRRASINLVATAMQAAGAISYKRGTLHLKDRQTLERMACECYETLAVNHQSHSSQ